MEDNNEYENKSFLGEIFSYFKIKKNWWLLPVLLMLAALGVFITVAANSGALSTFIYALG